MNNESKMIDKRGMEVLCSRCRISKMYVAWIDKKKWPWGAMTMAIQTVIHRFGWKTISKHFVCPKCQTDEERDTDYSKTWFDEYYEMWKENKVNNE